MTNPKRECNKPMVVPIFSWTIYVVFSEDQFEYLMKQHDLDMDFEVFTSMDGACVEMVTTGGSSFNLVYIDEVDGNAGIIVHESVHAVHDMMESRGIPISKENTEVMAYTTEWVYNEIVSRFELHQERRQKVLSAS